MDVPPSCFIEWLTTWILPRSARTHTSDAAALNFPLGWLFLGIVNAREGNFDAGAALIVRAWLSDDARVQASKPGKALAAVYSDVIKAELAIDEHHPTEAALAAALADALREQPECVDADPVANNVDVHQKKRSRHGDADAASSSDGVVAVGAAASMKEDELLARRRVQHAAAHLRGRVLRYLNKHAMHWSRASPLVMIQKLLFYANAAHVALYGGPLFSSEPVAWAEGPVYVDARNALMLWHARREKASFAWPDDQSALSASELHLLDAVFERLGDAALAEFGADATRALIDYTHEEPPWRDAADVAKALRLFQSATITSDAIVRWAQSRSSRVLRYLLDRTAPPPWAVDGATPTAGCSAAAAAAAAAATARGHVRGPVPSCS